MRNLWVLLILCCCGSAVAGEVERRLAKQVFIDSGQQQQVALIPKAIELGFEEAVGSGEFGQYPEHVLPQLRADFRSAFSSEKLEISIVDSLASTLKTRELQDTLSWYRSKPGGLITGVELVNSSLVDNGERSVYLDSLENDAHDLRRLEVMQQLENAWQVVSTSVDMMVNMQIALTTAMLSLLPEADAVPVSRIVALYEAGRVDLHAHLADKTLLSMLYIYKDIPTTDLVKYTDFALSASGRVYVEVSNAALQRSMLTASLRLGESIGQLLSTDTTEGGI